MHWSDLGGNPEAHVVGYLCLAKTRLALGDPYGAIALMEKSGEAARHPAVSPFFQSWHAASRALFALWRDELVEALRWGEIVSKYAKSLPFAFHHIPARLLIARGERAAAAEQLQSLYDAALEGDALGLVVVIRVYQALAAEIPEEALDLLSDALSRGQREGFIRTFIDEGRLLAPLLRKALSKRITPEYTAKLLSIIAAEQTSPRPHERTGVASSEMPKLLSRKELEVLRLMSEGLSNRKIAEKLFITLNTAKTHIHNISQRLDVSTRTQIVARARELKLI